MYKTIVFSLDSRIKLRPIQIRQDRKNCIVEDVQTGQFYEMPRICADTLEWIQAEMCLADVQRKINELYPGEEADLLEFITILYDSDLLAEVDGHPLERIRTVQRARGFSWLPQWAGRLFFNPISLGVYAFIFAADAAAFVIKPSLIPNYKDLFVFDSMTANSLLWLGVTTVLLCIHEIGHVLSIRSEGLPTRLSLGHRYFLVVMETDLSGAWGLPPRRRNILYLAGLCMDTVMLAGCLWMQIAWPDAPGALNPILSLAVFDLCMKLMYQFCVFMKTDIYFVLENSSGCYNLMEQAKQVLGAWLPWLKPKQHIETFDGERGWVKTYAWLYMLGMLLMVFLFLCFFVPQFGYALIRSSSRIVHPGNAYFWDAVVFFMQSVFMLALLVFSWFRRPA